MPSELDHAPHLLLLELEAKSTAGAALTQGAVIVLEKAGATFETIQVKQPTDLAIAAAFAAKSKSYDAIVVLADLGDVGHAKGLISSGLQQIAIAENMSIGSGLTINQDEQSAKREGSSAVDSALRLFAIKARFNPMLNEA